LPHAVVHPADIAVVLVLSTLFGLYPFLRKFFADGGYQGPQFCKAQTTALRPSRCSGEGLCRPSRIICRRETIAVYARSKAGAKMREKRADSPDAFTRIVVSVA
jgi:hypothetical protein